MTARTVAKRAAVTTCVLVLGAGCGGSGGARPGAPVAVLDAETIGSCPGGQGGTADRAPLVETLLAIPTWYQLDSIERTSAFDENGVASAVAEVTEPRRDAAGSPDAKSRQDLTIDAQSLGGIEQARDAHLSVVVGIGTYGIYPVHVRRALAYDLDGRVVALGICGFQSFTDDFDRLARDQTNRTGVEVFTEFLATGTLAVADSTATPAPTIDPRVPQGRDLRDVATPGEGHFVDALMRVEVPQSWATSELNLCTATRSGWNECIAVADSALDTDQLEYSALVSADEPLEFWLLEADGNNVEPIALIGTVDVADAVDLESPHPTNAQLHLVFTIAADVELAGVENAGYAGGDSVRLTAAEWM